MIPLLVSSWIRTDMRKYRYKESSMILWNLTMVANLRSLKDIYIIDHNWK